MYLFKVCLNKYRFIGAIVAATVMVAPVAATAATAYVSASVNVRAGPGTNYGKLATLPAGAAVNAGFCRYGWCPIYNGPRPGFVSARYIRFGSYRAQAYSAPTTTTVIIDNGYDGGWAPGYRGHGWRGGRNYYDGCIGFNCQPWRRGRNHWNPRWGIGPAWPFGQAGHYWGPGPVGPRFNSGGFNRPAVIHGFGASGGGHFGNVRPMHAGR